MDKNHRAHVIVVLLALIVVVTSLVAVAIYWHNQLPAVVKTKLNQADQECETELATQLQSLDRFFAEAKRGTRQFAANALSLRSKWYYLTSKQKFRKYLSDKFQEHIFTPEQLKQALMQCVGNYCSATESIENQMLVRICADIANLEPTRLPELLYEDNLHKAYEEALQQVQRQVGHALLADVGLNITSWVAADIAEAVIARVLTRLSVSGTVLGFGAASSWETFGITMLAAIIIDQLISWIWDWIADPKGKMSEQLQQKLDEIHTAIIAGDGKQLGLRETLKQIAQSRSQMRREAILIVWQKIK